MRLGLGRDAACCPPAGSDLGKNKSDVIDADVLAMAGDVFTLSPLRPPARRSWHCVVRSSVGASSSSTATVPADG